MLLKLLGQRINFYPKMLLSGKKVLLKIHYIIPAEGCEWSVVMLYFITKKKKKVYKENLTPLRKKKQYIPLVPNIVRFDQFKMYAILAFSGTLIRLQRSRWWA